jgi:hypothetical protein
MAFAHAVSDKVEVAYRRGDLFEKRRRLMAEWAAYCDAPAAVTPAVSLCGADQPSEPCDSPLVQPLIKFLASPRFCAFRQILLGMTKKRISTPYMLPGGLIIDCQFHDRTERPNQD